MYKVTEEQKNALVNELAKLPYVQVAGIINFLNNLPKEEVTAEKIEEDK